MQNQVSKKMHGNQVLSRDECATESAKNYDRSVQVKNGLVQDQIQGVVYSLYPITQLFIANDASHFKVSYLFQIVKEFSKVYM